MKTYESSQDWTPPEEPMNSNEINSNQIEEAVWNIQQDIFESTKDVEFAENALSINVVCQKVEFCGIELWSSEDDTRLYINKDDEDCDLKESIDTCLRRRLNEELAKLKMIVIA